MSGARIGASLMVLTTAVFLIAFEAMPVNGGAEHRSDCRQAPNPA